MPVARGAGDKKWRGAATYPQPQPTRAAAQPTCGRAPPSGGRAARLRVRTKAVHAWEGSCERPRPASPPHLRRAEEYVYMYMYTHAHIYNMI